MNSRHLVRDLALITTAAAIGWWAHGTRSVHAATTPPLDLSFQLEQITGNTWLTLYDATTHNLYVYPSALSNSTTNCSYSLHIDKPGAPITRTNCPIGPNH